jgi:hypothetical protein
MGVMVHALLRKRSKEFGVEPPENTALSIAS